MKNSEVEFILNYLYYQNHITKEEQDSILKMLKSPDKENRQIAIEILKNYKLEEHEDKSERLC
jgi:hypothetical protein